MTFFRRISFATITKIVMDTDYNVGFYNQYNILVVTLDHAMKCSIFGTYLICEDDNKIGRAHV